MCHLVYCIKCIVKGKYIGHLILLMSLRHAKPIADVARIIKKSMA